jgi:hypothetical protein
MHVIEIFLPLYDRAGAAIERSRFETVRRELVETFGGATAFLRAPAQGFWQDERGRVERDDVVVFEAMTEDLDRAWWTSYRETLEARFAQEEVVVRAYAIERL